MWGGGSGCVDKFIIVEGLVDWKKLIDATSYKQDPLLEEPRTAEL